MQGTSGEETASESSVIEEDFRDARLNSRDSASSICGFTYIKDRAEKLRHERTRLWAAAADPNEMHK